MATLYREIKNLIRKNKEADRFLNDLLKISDVYLFGGAVRDYLNDNFQNIRDFDFVINSKDGSLINIEDYLYDSNTIIYKKNRFGGYKINFNGIIIDIWNLKDTWLFKAGYMKPSINNLINSVYLNIDSLVYLLNNDEYINNCDKNYKDIFHNKIIDIVYKENPYEELNLLRALVLKKRYSFDFSDEIKNKFYEYSKNNFYAFKQNLLKIQQEHYNKQFFTSTEIETEIETLLMLKN